MTTRPHLSLSLSREPSTTRSYRSRRISTESARNVFSDDHELDSPVTVDDEPLSNIPRPRQQYFDDPFSDNQAPNTVPFSDNLRFSADRNSTRKPRLMIDDVPTTSDRGLGRSMSTSSRITIPRSQSPYNGPTAPSHPYTMYPQLTRASSIASQSTLRPGPETPFVPPRNGPEHPYQLYPQNTVPEVDEDITAHGIPVLGFPRNGFPSSSGGSSTEVGDIIGSDGHVEQLPPYTRYADNTVAKGNMDRFNERRLSQRPSRTSMAPSASTQPAPPSNTASTTLLAPPREEFDQEQEEEQMARKEGWREKVRRRTCLGMPLWGIIVIVLSILFAGTVGGVVGGVIGNRQGQQQAWAAGAITTIWLDAIPTTLGPNSSPLPTGHYQIPLNQSQEVNKCISEASYSTAWGCMDIAYIGLNVSQSNGVYQAMFEDFSVNTADFRYGPQPPDFNGTAFNLQPMSDKDDGNLGVAMFFSVLFDKLLIIPEWALRPDSERRATTWDVYKRSAIYDGTPLEPSQRPWFCFWNSTINEFFIYLNEDAPIETTSTATVTRVGQVQSTSHSSPTTTVFSSTTSIAALADLTVATSPTPTATVFQAYNPIPPRPTGAHDPKKRSYDIAESSISNYPKLIKMVEKRKPYSTDSLNVQPYCQKMQVLDNRQIVPFPNAEKICIDEEVYTTSSTVTATAATRMRVKPREYMRDVVSDLESYCICEWKSH